MSHTTNERDFETDALSEKRPGVCKSKTGILFTLLVNVNFLSNVNPAPRQLNLFTFGKTYAVGLELKRAELCIVPCDLAGERHWDPG